MRVFLSYRRGDGGGRAGRLHDALVQRLGARNVFLDVAAIAPGKDFVQEIDRALGGCDAALAVIGEKWLAEKTEAGEPRLFQPDDFVRLELGRALQRAIPVVPVLVGGATLPAAKDLPEDLQLLPRQQAVELHDQTWHEDVDGLVRRLRGKPTTPTTPKARHRWVVGAAAVLTLAMLGGIAWWLWPDGGDGGDDTTETVPPCGATDSADWQAIELADDPEGEYRLDDGPLFFRVREARSRALGPGTWQVVLDTRMENGTPSEQYHGDWYYENLVVGRRPAEKACFSASPELIDSNEESAGKVGFEVVCEPVGYIELVLGDEGERIDVTSDALDAVEC